jgi:NAD(P)-dependent dehydrogenase (short-subunit alcohol dehydrogenase family)
MNQRRKTAIVTGASQGIGAGIVNAFIARGFNVVANSRNMTQSKEVTASPQLALVDGDIGLPATAANIAQTAVSRFGSIDALVNNAGIFLPRPFVDYSVDDFKLLVSTNVEGYLYITQLCVKQMLAQKTGGSVVTISASTATNPMAGVNVSMSMFTKGGLNTVNRHLAVEYAKQGIRFNVVAPGVVDTPMHNGTPKEAIASQNPLGVVLSVKDIVDAVMYLNDASSVTGEILNVAGGSQLGRW